MTSSHRSPSPAVLLPLFLVLAAAAYRYAKLAGHVNIPALENFSPWMALAFTGTLLASQRFSFLLIPLLLVCIDIVATGTSAVMHWEALAVYPCFAIAALLASRGRGQLGMMGALLGVAGCSIAFYVITNTVSWISYPYAKTFAGWVQALTTGEVGHAPTWWFLRNSLISDLGFSILLFAVHNTEAKARQQQTIPWVATASA